MGEPTIGERLDELDVARFVGRTTELDRLASLLVDEPTVNVVLVHGPGGIGKSALLRELGRRARALGWTTALIEGRDLPATPDGIEAAFADLGDPRRALVVFDSWERASGLTGFLRDHVLAHLPVGWIAVVAGRDEPDVGWTRDGWEYVCQELRLGPLADGEALECARRHGVDDDDRAARLVEWAAGSPLALVLSARAGTAWEPGEVAPAEVVDPLVRRLVDSELDEGRLAVLGTAAIARVTTPELLASAVSSIDASEAYLWLTSRSFVEALGDGVALHALVGRTVRAHLELHHSELARDLRRRIADHAFVQAQRTGGAPSYDLVWLVDNPALRWGFGWDESGRLRIDRVRPGDLEAIESRLDPDPSDDWWSITRRYFLESPAHVIVARDPSELPAGFAVIATSADWSPLPDDPLFVPWLADARIRASDGGAVLWSRSTRVTADPGVHALLGLGGVLMSGLDNPRYLYLPIDPYNSEAVAFSASLGACHLSELDVELSGTVTECHIVDLGPGGLLAAQRDAVYRELGIVDAPAPRSLAAAQLDVESVRTLLRDVDRPDRLACSTLARGTTVSERAQSVRALLDTAVERAFASGAHDARLRAVIAAGYLERTTTHETVASSLHMSRAVYFRLAREASERITVVLQAMLAGDNPASGQNERTASSTDAARSARQMSRSGK